MTTKGLAEAYGKLLAEANVAGLYRHVEMRPDNTVNINAPHDTLVAAIKESLDRSSETKSVNQQMIALRIFGLTYFSPDVINSTAGSRDGLDIYIDRLISQNNVLFSQSINSLEKFLVVATIFERENLSHVMHCTPTPEAMPIWLRVVGHILAIVRVRLEQLERQVAEFVDRLDLADSTLYTSV